jgi:hypothetical protein
MRQRARPACEATIPRGHGMWEVPVGCVRTRDDRMEKSADRPVPHAGAGVCQKCRELGRARQPMRWYREAPRPLPEVCPGTLGRDLRWRLPSAPRLHQRLRHPSSAGALVYGRPAAQTVIVAGRARQSQRRQKPGAPWRMLLLDQHAGSLGWEDFLPPHNSWKPSATGRRRGPGRGATGACPPQRRATVGPVRSPAHCRL